MRQELLRLQPAVRVPVEGAWGKTHPSSPENRPPGNRPAKEEKTDRITEQTTAKRATATKVTPSATPGLPDTPLCRLFQRTPEPSEATEGERSPPRATVPPYRGTVCSKPSTI